MLGRTPLALGLVLALGALSACGTSDADSAGNDELTELKVGALPLPDYAALYWADQKGYFEDEGLTVELQPLQGGPVGIQRVGAGDLHCSFANTLSTITAQTSGVPIKLMALSSAIGDQSQTYAVAADSPIQSMADIVDVTVGVHTTNNVADLLFLNLAEDEGIEVSPNFVEVPMPEMIDGIKAGSIEVGYMGEPFATAARADGLREVVDLTAGPNAGLAAASFICGSDFVEENPETAEAFQRALYAAGQGLMEDEQGLREWAQDEGGVPAELVDQISLPTFFSEFEPDELTRVADLLDGQGLLKADYDISEHVFQP